MNFSSKKQGIYDKNILFKKFSYTMEKIRRQKNNHRIKLEVQETTY
jgi:hypothetical protein